MPRLGSVNFGRSMPRADYFSTLYIWITKNEKLFKEKYGCGNIDVHHRRRRTQEQTCPYPIPKEFIGSAHTYNGFNATEHPVVRLEDDHNILGIALESTEENNYMAVAVYTGLHNMVVHLQAKRQIKAGDVITVDDVALQNGGEEEDGEDKTSE